MHLSFPPTYRTCIKFTCIFFIVAVNITNVSFPEGSNNMTAGYPLRIRVEIFGNPSSTVSWKIRQSNELIKENTLVFNVIEFQLDHVTCLHTNDYILTASNRVGNMSLKHFSLNVLCEYTYFLFTV